MSIAEGEAAHRHKNEDKLVDESIHLERKGQVLAFIIAMVSMVIILVSLFLSQPFGAIAPAIVALTSLASVFAGKKTASK